MLKMLFSEMYILKIPGEGGGVRIRACEANCIMAEFIKFIIK